MDQTPPAHGSNTWPDTDTDADTDAEGEQAAHSPVSLGVRMETETKLL